MDNGEGKDDSSDDGMPTLLSRPKQVSGLSLKIVDLAGVGQHYPMKANENGRAEKTSGVHQRIFLSSGHSIKQGEIHYAELNAFEKYERKYACFLTRKNLTKKQ
jgi:hypothetical protein